MPGEPVRLDQIPGYEVTADSSPLGLLFTPESRMKSDLWRIAAGIWGGKKCAAATLHAFGTDNPGTKGRILHLSREGCWCTPFRAVTGVAGEINGIRGGSDVEA
jgi:hypothetical protein